MPRIDDLIDRLVKARYISTLDLTRGYWQVPMAKALRHLTAFTMPFGLIQFRVMPFGLQGAPATFQRLMDKVLHCLEDYAAAYIDDLVIHSTTCEEHLTQIPIGGAHGKAPEVPVRNVKMCVSGTCGGQWPGTT